MNDLADAAQHRELEFERKPPPVVTLSTGAYYEKGKASSTLRALVRKSGSFATLAAIRRAF
jgi:hypothetical protein